MERRNGGAGIDDDTEQLRTEGYHEQARGRGEGKGHDGVCPYRSCRGGATEVLIFGNAKAGTPLMQSVQTIGLDLPLKALVWQDASGVTR